MRLLRSLLFVPGNRERMLARAGTLGEDAVILDLEDSVPLAEKEATRPHVRQAIDAVSQTTGAAVFVRVNPLGAKTAYSADLGAQDLAAVACANLAGVILPKVESPDEVLAADALLRQRERALGLPEGQCELVPMLETAKGILFAYDIARAAPGRVRCLSTGFGDLTVDLGIAWTRGEEEVLYARSHLAIASRAAGLEQPLDGVWADIADQQGLVRSARLARQLGYQGKTLIHPSQVAPVNAVFSPTPEEMARAEQIVAAFSQAEAEGKASIRFAGRMLDYPELERARQTLARARAFAARAR
ncbi:MAG: CoA ester lyase [Chloroflexi bacterium]|nr:CoA ester lyase [Chloroflexota bacterium]